MNEFNEMKDEKELLLKLFETDHLNVPERSNLPNGIVRLSVAKKLIADHLIANGWFPGHKQKPVGDHGGQYFQLEYESDNRIILHHNFEYSYLKYKHQVIKHKTLSELITSYLKEKEKEGLDGLKIDWKS
ncbi:MAG: hypothetical protein GY705_10095 [Bacteroidetes bacterium]|nr:hypothetical protein [Bacteroidota bacterium]